MPSIKRVVVIGGGAAGYFSAIECAKLLSESQGNTKGPENFNYEVFQTKRCTSHLHQRLSKFHANIDYSVLGNRP